MTSCRVNANDQVTYCTTLHDKLENKKVSVTLFIKSCGVGGLVGILVMMGLIPCYDILLRQITRLQLLPSRDDTDGYYQSIITHYH